jgi:hypothetical protein
MKSPFVFGICAGLFVSGCATELTEAGQGVQIGKSEPAAGCRPMGPVYGTGAGGGYTDSETKLRSAQNDMRNRAADIGANYVVMDAMGSDLHGMTMSGRAFRCDGSPSSAAMTPVAPAPAKAETLEERLTKLKQLLDKGLITQEEYDRRRAEIVQSL